ncbi:hypothetical protein [Frankia sp. ACN1ag]|uniref:hypothetical protein n=1 Tax=Frankia sp. ACN1ag TaxID=102891 RepID=UPI001F17AF8F|nr:hypothetical protein [Frankia sp. ACN1ag]
MLAVMESPFRFPVHACRRLGDTAGRIGGTVHSDVHPVMIGTVDGSTTAASVVPCPAAGRQPVGDCADGGGLVSDPMLIWKGKNADQRLFWSRAHSDGSWRDQQQVRYFATNRGGIGAASDGRLTARAAWRGADDDSRIWTAGWYGDGWSDQQTPVDAPRTEDRPALAFHDDRTVMAWRGVGPDQTIWFSENLGPQRVAGGQASSTHGPALASYGGLLYMAWKGSGGDQGLYWTTYDGHTWAQPRPFPGGSTHGPALAASPQALFLVWKGSGNDAGIWHAEFQNGRWSAQRPAPGGTSTGPSAAYVGNTVITAWKGVGADARMWTCRNFREPQIAVANGAFGTSDTPAVVSTFVTEL